MGTDYIKWKKKQHIRVFIKIIQNCQNENFKGVEKRWKRNTLNNVNRLDPCIMDDFSLISCIFCNENVLQGVLLLE